MRVRKEFMIQLDRGQVIGSTAMCEDITVERRYYSGVSKSQSVSQYGVWIKLLIIGKANSPLVFKQLDVSELPFI
jgi:hypothetical protein